MGAGALSVRAIIAQPGDALDPLRDDGDRLDDGSDGLGDGGDGRGDDGGHSVGDGDGDAPLARG